MSKCHDNYQAFKNEVTILRLPELDQTFIIRYIYAAEDENFGYLCLQLYEYTLEEYIEDCPDNELYVILRYILKSIKVLHDQKPPIIHRDINPQNYCIDVIKRVRLARLGSCLSLPDGQTTLNTVHAGTKNWMAKETLTGEDKENWKTDVQVLGMLIYYILSRGHHPFGTTHECENNILEGKYSLDHVKDVLAKDLIDLMINEDPKKRPKVEECLKHPIFWPEKKRLEYLRHIANRTEVARHKKATQNFIRSLDPLGYFKGWKNKFPQDLVQKMDGKDEDNPCYSSDNPFALLRFIRNVHEH
ncbi:hypothetical protein PAMP_015650 [Pampus punctatissimus]